jgi:hypothetical protein
MKAGSMGPRRQDSWNPKTENPPEITLIINSTVLGFSLERAIYRVFYVLATCYAFSLYNGTCREYTPYLAV